MTIDSRICNLFSDEVCMSIKPIRTGITLVELVLPLFPFYYSNP